VGVRIGVEQIKGMDYMVHTLNALKYAIQPIANVHLLQYLNFAVGFN